ncbi:MAG: DUF5009 domain-containing protein [Pedosphaera sp.]|nr:DUF5009 domain-containing protein [Pedosphaera sp.]
MSPESVGSTAVGTSSVSARLMSIDALRGFDMFWIMGADSLGQALAKLVGGAGLMHHLAEQLDHVPWKGFRFYDLIFPLFVFVAGVSSVFSLTKAMESGGPDAALVRVLKRTLLLYVLGLFYYGGFAGKLLDSGEFTGKISDIRLMGVLQRIAIASGAAGVLFIYCRPRTLFFWLMAILGGYWALMAFVPVPGVGASSFIEGKIVEGKNLANWIDAHYLWGRLWDGDHDPEGLLSNLPAIGTCLLGVLAGIWLKSEKAKPERKAAMLAVAGVSCLFLGFVWGLQFPIIKKLWTSSYVLVAGGWSLLLLAGFYQLVDVWGWRRWCRPFVWVGMNAITVYLASNLVDFDKLAERFAGGDIKRILDRTVANGFGGLVLSLTSILLGMLLARALYQRKVFIRL